MTSKVDPQLCLDKRTQTVVVTGPILDWEDDELSATFSVTVVQAPSDGDNPAQAAGASTVVYVNPNPAPPPAAHPNPGGPWTVQVSRLGPGPKLDFGGATVYATATIRKVTGGFESYTWPVPVRLVRC